MKILNLEWAKTTAMSVINSIFRLHVHGELCNNKKEKENSLLCVSPTEAAM
jgi:hypothetical protein